MAETKATKTPKNPAAAKLLTKKVKAAPCSKSFEFFKNVTLGPGQHHDSTTAKKVDCYQWLHVWVLAQHANHMAMDNISVQLVFELPGKMGAAGLANLEISSATGIRPTPLQVSSGAPAGGYGGFVIRAPIIGPGVRVIVSNGGAQTYAFNVWGYATH